ncbi:hypothetical protein [Aquabacter sediminis]|uniref:hypothetical protein n=1 Tax=Aquabacter sediminis TaxID=3029197 RepID=UPI00237E3CAD|nr:hypothetical protein [Aquabacter sp. P-9]MDE1567242.1 hypothetical protein [Aquabacter sp. P-9]
MGSDRKLDLRVTAAVFLLIFAAFSFAYSTVYGPVGEFGNYIAASRWSSVYGMFFRPLSLNLFPYWLNEGLGISFSRYSYVFSALFCLGIFISVAFLIQMLRWSSRENFKVTYFVDPLFLILFGFSNVFIITTLMIQYTITDFLFMCSYALFLLSILRFLNNGSLEWRDGVLAVLGLTLMCGSKEFTLVTPVMLLVLLVLRFRPAIRLVKEHPARVLVVALLLSVVASLYVMFLVTQPTYIANTLAGGAPPGEDFIRASSAKFLSNLWTCLLWVGQVPLQGNYPYVFNPLPLLGPVSTAILWTYGIVLILGWIAAFSHRDFRPAAVFNLVGVLFWIVLAASNNRALSSYLAPAFLHGAILWAMGAWVTLERIGSSWFSGSVKVACLGLLIWSMWLGSNTLYSPDRTVSFHGAMAASDGQLRSTLRAIAQNFDRFQVTFDLNGAPDYVPFHLHLGGRLASSQLFVMDDFVVDSKANTVLVKGHRPGVAADGEYVRVIVRVEPDPLKGSRFRFVSGMPLAASSQ